MKSVLFETMKFAMKAILLSISSFFADDPYTSQQENTSCKWYVSNGRGSCCIDFFSNPPPKNYTVTNSGKSFYTIYKDFFAQFNPVSDFRGVPACIGCDTKNRCCQFFTLANFCFDIHHIILKMLHTKTFPQ